MNKIEWNAVLIVQVLFFGWSPDVTVQWPVTKAAQVQGTDISKPQQEQSQDKKKNETKHETNIIESESYNQITKKDYTFL